MVKTIGPLGLYFIDKIIYFKLFRTYWIFLQNASLTKKSKREIKTWKKT